MSSGEHTTQLPQPTDTLLWPRIALCAVAAALR
jgi:hypothetical protein